MAPSSNFGFSSLQNLLNQENMLISFPEAQQQQELQHYTAYNFDYNNLSLSSDNSVDNFLPHFYHSQAEIFAFPQGQELALEPPCLYPKPLRTTLQSGENLCRFNVSTTTSTSFDFSTWFAPNITSITFAPDLLLPEQVVPEEVDFRVSPIASNVYGCQNQKDLMDKEIGSTSGGGSTRRRPRAAVSARDRRRRITEKIRELGRLIPGANKMSTAEMLLAASKYVKFLQAQLGILKLVASCTDQKKKEQILGHNKELQVLASPIIQEKLYIEEKCLVPKEFVQALLANDHNIN